MASFKEHISQARHNHNFYNIINATASDNFFDWLVTVNFYICVHLVNAHLAYSKNAHYRRHKDVEIAINPYKGDCKVPENVFVAYKKLHNLSRRSRYLIHEDNHMHSETCVHHTSERHHKKSLNTLIEIVLFFEQTYNIELFPKNVPA